MLAKLSHNKLIKHLFSVVVLVFLLQSTAWAYMPIFIAGESQAWMVICTANGYERVLIRELKSDKSTGEDNLLTHCDLCVFASNLGYTPNNNVSVCIIEKIAYRIKHKQVRYSLGFMHYEVQARAPPYFSGSIKSIT